MMKKIVSSLILLSLSACSVFSKDVVELKEKPVLNLDSSNYLDSLNDVTFIVLDKNTCQNKFNQKKVLIAMTIDNYRNLSLNQNILKNYIIVQKEIIEQYKRYYEKD